MLVAVPLTLLAAVATHFSARRSVRLQPADGPTAAVMRWTPWVFPLGVLVSGVFFAFPIAILLYWLINSTWTLGQQRLVHRRQHQPPTFQPLPGPTVAVRERRAAPGRPRRHASGHRPRRRRR